MLALKQNRIGLVVLVVFTIFNLLACAGFPSDPRAPEAGDDTYKMKEDELLNVPVKEGILANDKPKEGPKIFLDTVGEVETQNKGTVNLAEDGSFTYVPATNFSGQDQVNYTIHNRKGKTGEATIFFEVAPVNDPPEPQDDRIDTHLNQPVTIDVLANDVDPDAGDTLVIQDVGTPDSGSVRLNADGTLTYTPRPNHRGDVSFDYTVSDGNGETGQARVYVTIGNTGLQDDIITVAEGDSITFPASDLLANDQNGAQLTVIGLGQAQNGTTVLEGDDITYTPDPHYSGPDSFTYMVEDANGITASATVHVNVTPVADPPTISDIPDQEINMGGTTGNLLFTVADPDTPLGDLQVSYRVTNADPANLIPANGVVLFYSGVLPTGTIRVTPDPTLSGTATITVTVADPDGNQASDAFVLTVNGANQPPTISNIIDRTISQGGATGPIPFTYGDPDPGTTPADLSLNYTITNADPANFAVELIANANGNGRIRITPAADYSGTATFTITITDPEGATASDAFNLIVNAVTPSLPPTINIDNYQQEYDLETVLPPISLPFTYSDPDTPLPQLQVDPAPSVTDPAGIINSAIATGNNGAGTVQVTLNTANTGTATITVGVSDPEGNEATASFQLRVIDPNNTGGGFTSSLSSLSLSTSAGLLTSSTPSAPLAQNDIYSTGINRTLSVGAIRGVLANDRDARDLTLRVTAIHNNRLTLNTNGGFSYTPPANFTGRQAFTYTVSNGSRSATATLTLVVGGNQIPRAVIDGYVTRAGVTLSIPVNRGLLANDSDPDGQTLSVISTGVYDTLFGGEVNIQPNGGFTYIAPANFDGFDSFTYKVSDGIDSAIGIAEVSVTP